MNFKYCGWLAGIVMFSGAALAESEVDVLTTVSVGTVDMDLEISESLIFPNDTSINRNKTRTARSKGQGAEIGVTVIDHKFYYGFTTQLKGQTVTDIKIDTTGFNSGQDSSEEIISRSSYSAYAGYSISDNVSLYAGITSGASSFGDEVILDDDGPFIGAKYVIRLGSYSSLTFDLSYSNLTTELTVKDDDLLAEEYASDIDTQGLSYSATWLRSLDRGRSFFVRLKVIEFSFDGSLPVIDQAAASINPDGSVTFDGSQTLTSLSLGMGF